MEDLLDGLRDVGYEFDEISFQKAIEGGPKSIPYTKLIEWITEQLKFLYSLEEHVNCIASVDDSSSFLMEVSSFLKEIGCQYTALTSGHINERLHSKNNRLLLVDYLLTELKAARMLRVNQPERKNELEVKLNESSTASDMKNMLLGLKFPKPPNNIPASVLFGKVETKVNDVIKKLQPNVIGKPMFDGTLTDKKWHDLMEIQKELHNEYKIRREMLLTRLDVTIRSFEWSDRLKDKTDAIETSYRMERQKMNIEPSVRLSDILAAREDLAILEKTSSASVRRKTKSEINSLIIGKVPDRGGRPFEQEPPPPEMPSWQQRSGGGQQVNNRGGGYSNQGGNRRGGRGGGRGGFNQAGTPNVNRASDSRFQDAGSVGGSGRVEAGWNSGPGYQGNTQNLSKPYQSGQYQSTGSSAHQSERNTGLGGYHDTGYSNRPRYANSDKGVGYQGSQSYGGGYQNKSDESGYNRDRDNNGYSGRAGSYRGQSNYSGQYRGGGRGGRR